MYFEGAAFFFIFATVKTVVVAQLVRASDCDSEGRGFEPPRLPLNRFPAMGTCFFKVILNGCINPINTFVYRSSASFSKKSGLTKH